VRPRIVCIYTVPTLKRCSFQTSCSPYKCNSIEFKDGRVVEDGLDMTCRNLCYEHCWTSKSKNYNPLLLPISLSYVFVGQFPNKFAIYHNPEKDCTLPWLPLYQKKTGCDRDGELVVLDYIFSPHQPMYPKKKKKKSVHRGERSRSTTSNAPWS